MATTNDIAEPASKMRVQQNLVYDAEDVARAAGLTWLGTPLDVAAWLRHRVTDSEWWGEHLAEDVHDVEVGRARSKKHSVGWFDRRERIGRIELTSGGCTIETALHELSHVVAEALHDSHSHDPWFARVHLELVYVFAEPDAYARLDRAYSAYGVEVAGEGIVFRKKGVIAL